MTLEEAILYDYIGEGTLLHYTTPQALASILKKGKLYVGRDGLNTIRPSAANKETVDNFKDGSGSHGRPSEWQTRDSRDRRKNLSAKDWKFNKYNAAEEQHIYDTGKNSIKVVIDGSKIKDGELRGLKVEKKNNAEGELFNLVKHSLDTIYDKSAKAFIQAVAPYINKVHAKNGGKKIGLEKLYKSIPEKKRKEIEKSFGIPHRGKMISALEAAYNYRGAGQKRKGTEIVKYKSNNKFSSIPVNGKFMKFEFTKMPHLKDQDLIELAKQIKDNKELFKGNDILTELLKSAEAVKKGEKPKREKKPIKIKKKKEDDKGQKAYHEIEDKDGKGFVVM
jgi:hypothetical protein